MAETSRSPDPTVCSRSSRSPTHPTRPVALKRRDLAELLAEELRRLDPDDVYAETVRALCRINDKAALASSRGLEDAHGRRDRPRPASHERAAEKAARKAAKRQSGGQEGRRQEDRRKKATTKKATTAKKTKSPQEGGLLMAAPTVLVHRTPEELAEAVCARLITTLVDIQASGRVPSWVLTGGTIADRIHAAVAASPAHGAVDWSRVDLWWGDERFLPAGTRRSQRDPGTQGAARQAATRPGPRACDGCQRRGRRRPGPGRGPVRRGAGRATRHEDHDDIPTFDIVMLGVGPDGHVASLFPERPALYEERAAVAVRNSPKPPPTRVTHDDAGDQPCPRSVVRGIR